MENPKIKTKVVHSETHNAYNVVGTSACDKFKIARLPYMAVERSEKITNANKLEALTHAEFISLCFNNSDKIIELLTRDKPKEFVRIIQNLTGHPFHYKEIAKIEGFNKDGSKVCVMSPDDMEWWLIEGEFKFI